MSDVKTGTPSNREGDHKIVTMLANKVVVSKEGYIQVVDGRVNLIYSLRVGPERVIPNTDPKSKTMATRDLGMCYSDKSESRVFIMKGCILEYKKELLTERMGVSKGTYVRMYGYNNVILGVPVAIYDDFTRHLIPQFKLMKKNERMNDGYVWIQCSISYPSSTKSNLDPDEIDLKHKNQVVLVTPGSEGPRVNAVGSVGAVLGLFKKSLVGTATVSARLKREKTDDNTSKTEYALGLSLIQFQAADTTEKKSPELIPEIDAKLSADMSAVASSRLIDFLYKANGGAASEDEEEEEEDEEQDEEEEEEPADEEEPEQEDEPEEQKRTPAKSHKEGKKNSKKAVDTTDEELGLMFKPQIDDSATSSPKGKK
jgi:Sec-independent protein translocase protein TatA